MTMPHLTNCAHSDDGWCLDCVVALNTRAEAAEDKATQNWIEVERLDAELARAESYIERIRVALGGNVDSDLALLAKTLDARNATLEGEVLRLSEEPPIRYQEWFVDSQIARAEAAESDARECRAERARYGDTMTSKLASAEAECEQLQIVDSLPILCWQL